MAHAKLPKPSWAQSVDVVMKPSSQAVEMAPDAIDTLEVGELLGKGQFKVVHRGTFKEKDVVVLHYSGTENGELTDSDKNELSMLRLIASAVGSKRYVPQLFGICTTADFTVVLQERAALGSIKAALKDTEVSPRLSSKLLARASYQLAGAMAFLQKLRIVHADLSCRNVLLCKLGDAPPGIVVKVSDFGLALLLEPGTESVTKKQPQATRWCAPETVTKMVLGHRADVWSYATTLWEMFAGGTVPWVKLDKRADVAARLKRLASRARSGPGARKADDLSADFPKKDMCPDFVYKQIVACLQVDESRRPSFFQIASTLRNLMPDADEESEPDETLPCEKKEENVKADEEEVARDADASIEDKEPDRFAQGGHTPSTGTPVSSCSVLIDMSQTPPRPCDRSCEDVSQRIKALEEFLYSARAIEALGEEAVFEMRMEVEATRARDMFLSDRRVRQEASRNRGKAGDGAPPYRGFAWPELPVDPAEEDVDRPLWSLWFFSSGALNQLRYKTELEAWAAFSSLRSVGSPCVLRDPCGAELASVSWVSMPAKLLTPLRMRVLPCA